VVVDVQHRGPGPERARRPPGRWIWAAIGAIVIIVLALSIVARWERIGSSGDHVTVYPTRIATGMAGSAATARTGGPRPR
jgi:hypothetical protein